VSEFEPELLAPGITINVEGYPYHPEFPGFLEDRPVPKHIPGQLELNVSTTKLPHWTKVVTGFGLAGLLYGSDHWARPTLKMAHRPQRASLGDWLQYVFDRLANFIQHETNYVTHEVSKGAAHAAHGPAHTLNLMAARWDQLSWNLVFLTRQLEVMFRRLVHTVIPREINKKVRPLQVRTRRLEKGLATETRDLNALRHWIHSQLNRHVYPRLGRVETKVNHTLPARIRRGEKLQARTQARVKLQGKLIGKLLPLLTIAGAVGLVTRALTKMGLNYIKCQNMKDVGSDLCASGPGAGRRLGRFLRGILSGLGGFLAPLFICQMFEAAALLVGPLMNKAIETIGFVGGALCDGKHDAAPPLVLQVTADPPVPNPLAI